MKWLNRSQEKILAAEYPIGNPFGGPAYGEKTDFGSAIGAGASLLGGAMASDSQSKSAHKAAKASQQASAQAQALQKEMYDQTRKDNEPWRVGGSSALAKLLQGIGVQNSSAPDKSEIYNTLKDKYTTTSSTWSYDGDGIPPIAFMGTNIFDDPRGPVWVEFERMKQFAHSSPSTTIDTAGLNKAVEDEYARQLDQYNQGQNDPFYGSLLKDFSMADYQQDPGYQFRLSEGMKGLDRSAAARGGLQSGAALKAAANYNQNAASQEYGNAYNRYNTNRGNQFNRLASVAGLGQTANTLNANYGSNYANNVSGNIMNNADNQANSYLAQGNSRGSAYSGIGNALGSMASKWGKNNYDYNTYNSTSDPLGAMGDAHGWWK